MCIYYELYETVYFPRINTKECFVSGALIFFMLNNKELKLVSTSTKKMRPIKMREKRCSLDFSLPQETQLKIPVQQDTPFSLGINNLFIQEKMRETKTTKEWK